MDERVYWIWLQNGLGAGSGKVRRVLEEYTSVRQFYDAGSEAWQAAGFLTQKEQENLSSFTLEDAFRRLAVQELSNIRVLTPADPGYPEKLRQIYDLPAVLYVRGNLPPLDDLLSIAVIGTRRATRPGRETALHLSEQLAQRGVVIVSGGAQGIDTAAHRGALSAKGSTVCVLGCGIGYNYLPENEGMRRQILERGALVSEYPKGTPPMKHHFPLRNRIIAGLSDGLVVVEAGAHSGSLITARQALEQNRDVFAVPGPLRQETAQGTNNLIKMGAKMVTDPGDILAEYRGRYSGEGPQPAAPVRQEPPVQQAPAETPAPPSLSKEAAAVYAALTPTPAYLADIGAQTGLPAGALRSILTELELEDLVQSYSGGRYSRR